MNNDSINSTLAIYIATHGPKCIIPTKNRIPLELGADFRNNFKYDIKDNIGEDNISKKNKSYCELTGLYWIWKNDKHEIVGMCHYRRYFYLTDKKIKKILCNEGYDVISNVFKGNELSLYDHYKISHDIKDLDTALDIIKEKYPEYRDKLENIIHTKKYYFCNMFITKKSIFNDYCSWLFPIIEELEKRNSNKVYLNKYQERYIGFVAERLFTIYILFNEYKIYDTGYIYYDSGLKLPLLTAVMKLILDSKVGKMFSKGIGFKIRKSIGKIMLGKK